MALSDTVAELSPDVRIIDICQQMLSVHQELDDLIERDPYAPDCGPSYGRHEALWDAFTALGDELIEAAPPTTSEGVQALAQVAMLFCVRTSEGNLRPESFADWVRLSVLTSAAGRPEMVPLPR